MPMVNGKEFPYTVKGKRDARMEAARSGKPIKKAVKKKAKKK